ncbi:hypothetical protein BD413DRAFT_573604 [Trametes elegans]|nr:hypothetical protein BD413DRAFT_573604 [Trametes elegans]
MWSHNENLDPQSLPDIMMEDAYDNYSPTVNNSLAAEFEQYPSPGARVLTPTQVSASKVPLKVGLFDRDPCKGETNSAPGTVRNPTNVRIRTFSPFIPLQDAVTPSLHALCITDLNYDVLERTMKLLSTASLSALMQTCRSFSEAALESLCLRSKEPFTKVHEVLSFLLFLRDGSVAPRWPFIEDLCFSGKILHYLAQIDGQGNHRAITQEDLFATILEVLNRCRNLRSLRLQGWNLAWKVKPLSQTLSTLTSLRELHIMVTKHRMTPYRLTRLRMCVPHLRTLKLIRGDVEIDTTLVRHILSPTALPLEELELNFHLTEACLPPTPFLHMRRLTIRWGDICFKFTLPGMLCRSFPHLQHLQIDNDKCPAGQCANAPPLNRYSMSASDARDHMEGIRAQYIAEWARASRDTIPALRSLSARHGCVLYAIAYPFPVPRVSFLQNAENIRGPILPVMETSTVVRDAAPRHLNLHITLRQLLGTYQPSPKPTEPVNALQALRASPNLTHLVLTVDCSHTCYTERDDDPHGVIEDAFRRDVPAARALTHLLVTYGKIPPPDERGEPKHAMACAHRRTLRTRAAETAALLAGSSPTLRWVGVWAWPYGIRAWEIRCGDALGGQGAGSADRSAHVLVEVPEDEAWAVVWAENMLEACEVPE